MNVQLYTSESVVRKYSTDDVYKCFVSSGRRCQPYVQILYVDKLKRRLAMHNRYPQFFKINFRHSIIIINY